MKFKDQDQLLDVIRKAVDQRSEEEQVAVFDADGTLWQEDANQILLDYQIEQEKAQTAKQEEKLKLIQHKQLSQKENQQVKFIKKEGSAEEIAQNKRPVEQIIKKENKRWFDREDKKREGLRKQNETHSKLETQLENQFIRSSKKELGKFSDLLSDYYQKYHRHELCQLFLKNQAGLSLTEFQAQSERALTETPLTVFPFQRKLLSYLNKQGLKIVVITASIQWLVELAVKKYNLPVDQVLGCQTELDLSEDLSSYLVDRLNLKGITGQSLILKDFCLLKSKESKRGVLSQSGIKKGEEGESKGRKQRLNQAEVQKQIELSQAELENLEQFDFKKEVSISDRMVRPSPGKDSKGEVFLKEYAKNSCLLAGGNTPSDFPLLELANLSFVVHSSEKDNIIFLAEQKMKEQALAKKWLIFEKEKFV